MKKSFYIIAFLTCFTFGLGGMFEFLIWPGRGILIFTGFMLFNFALLPMLFFQMYRSRKSC